MILLSNGANSIWDLITVLVIFVFVIAITLFTTRYVANYQKGKNSGRNVEIIETTKIAQNKYVQIVKLGNHYVAMAVCKDTVTVLTELSEDEIRIPTDEGSQMDFKDILQKLKEKHILEKSNDLKDKE